MYRVGGVRFNPRPDARLRTSLVGNRLIPQSSPPCIVVSGLIYNSVRYITPSATLGLSPPPPPGVGVGLGGVRYVVSASGALGWAKYIGASSILLLHLAENIISNSYPGGRRAPSHPVGQSFSRAQSGLGRAPSPPLYHCLEN